MKTLNLYTTIAILAIFSFSSCDDFLDKSPDSRSELDTPEQISKLLIDGYSDGNYGLIAELSSDNFIDNNSPDENGDGYNLSSFDKLHDEIFAWEDAIASEDQDSPSAIWSGCYHAIAVANHALEKIAEFEKEGRSTEVRAQKGEALMIRAYNHFVLANVFCQTYKNDELSKTDKGIPYILAPETKVLVEYNRSNVTDTYAAIEKDLLDGIDLIDDAAYTVPKYHFNKQAANAFATRFYLYKRNYEKVIKYATAALGNAPQTYMRDWNIDYPTYLSFAYGWINTSSNNNFMLVSTASWFNRLFGERYACNRDASAGTIDGTGPTWTNYSFHPCYNGRLYLRGDAEFGLFFPKCGEFFEYTNKIAGIGYGHIVRAEFTGEETLLCRAEAYVYLNRIAEAVTDLKIFDDSHKITGYNFTDLTQASIIEFYTSNRSLFVKKFNTTNISPDFVVSNTQKPIIDCILHFRRLETIYDGYRWFDLKRYGIEITHKIGKDRTEVLKWNDERRAIQIPAEVISAGLQPNYRAGGANTSPIIKANK